MYLTFHNQNFTPRKGKYVYQSMSHLQPSQVKGSDERVSQCRQGIGDLSELQVGNASLEWDALDNFRDKS